MLLNISALRQQFQRDQWSWALLHAHTSQPGSQQDLTDQWPEQSASYTPLPGRSTYHMFRNVHIHTYSYTICSFGDISCYVFYLMYTKSQLFYLPPPVSLGLSPHVCVLAIFLYSGKSWPHVWGSPYGPAAVFCPLAVLPRCQHSHWSPSLIWDQLLVSEWAWTKFSAHLAPCPPSIYLIPSPSSHDTSLNSAELSASLFHSPSQRWPLASRTQHIHPPPLTAALCQAACLARVG